MDAIVPPTNPADGVLTRWQDAAIAYGDAVRAEKRAHTAYKNACEEFRMSRDVLMQRQAASRAAKAASDAAQAEFAAAQDQRAPVAAGVAA
jgi:ABC-type transporter lipoprotein component MlaA